MRSAKIIVPRRASVIHCTVQNITSGGACLKLANTFGVPETFELTFEHGRTRRSCRVIWRTNDKLGVAFEGCETCGGGQTSLKLRHGADQPLDVFRPRQPMIAVLDQSEHDIIAGEPRNRALACCHGTSGSSTPCKMRTGQPVSIMPPSSR